LKQSYVFHGQKPVPPVKDLELNLGRRGKPALIVKEQASYNNQGEPHLACSPRYPPVVIAGEKGVLLNPPGQTAEGKAWFKKPG